MNFKYVRINSIKSAPSDAGNVSEARLMSQVLRLREFVCALISAFAIRAAKVPVFVCLRSSYYNVTGGGGLSRFVSCAEGCYAK